MLRQKGLKSLLGVPLMIEGEVIGVLHVGSLRPRLFGPDDVEVLQRVGDRAALSINGRLAEQDRGLADALQRSLIPRLPELPGLTLEARYLPAAEATLGGDWYDAFLLPGGSLGLAIGDVSGRGFRAAALMGQLRSGLRACAMGERSPALAAERLSDLLRQLDSARTATLLFLALDPQAGRIEMMSAGHPPPLVVDADGTRTLPRAADGRAARRRPLPDLRGRRGHDRAGRRAAALHRRRDRAARRADGHGARAAARRGARPLHDPRLALPADRRRDAAARAPRATTPPC